ncbi:MAG: VWA domain-containing protein [Acidimicrobiales bacterium]|nr:VWA domain-containing protein [Acidimicrobiales bacterium]RZV46314.1 MAG: VWA domain-containing protein [Acidimicrobiales bacterium]
MADAPVDTSIVDRLVEFGTALREHGLPVGTDDVLAFCSAVAELTPSDSEDVYWSGRATLVHRRDHIPVYDEVFRRFFLHVPASAERKKVKDMKVPQGSTGTINIPDAEPGDRQSDERPMVLGLEASSLEIERSKRFSACSEAELAAVRRMINKIRLEPPKRRTRRYCTDPSGSTLDIRQMARRAMNLNDAAPELLRMDRKRKQRPLVLLLDISGSMADHSRNLLQFAYSMKRAAQKVEVFCFGTRLTRITPLLDRRSPDAAMRLASERVVDWDGGTRIGDSVEAFVKDWGRRGLSRGATVIICSDGLDRGSPATLAESMEKLERLSHRIIWMNPLQELQAGVPPTLAMAVAGPHIDEIASGNNLESLEAFAGRLPQIG